MIYNEYEKEKMERIMARKKATTHFRKSWGTLLALGIFLILLGTLGLWMAVGLTLVSILLLGVILIIAGVAQLIDIVKSRYWGGMLLHAIIGILYIAGGALVIYDPILASA